MVDSAALTQLFLVATPVLYFLAVGVHILVFASDVPWARRLVRPLLVSAVVVNGAYLVAFTAVFEHIPLVTPPQVVGAVGFALAAVYLWIESRTHTTASGPFVLTLVLVCQVLNTAQPRLDHYVPDLLRSKLFSVHVSAAVLGYSAFALAAVYGLLYLLLYHRMRDKSFGLVFRRLPPLETLDRMNYYATSVGFALLSVAVAVGGVWSVVAFDSVRFDVKIVTALVTWALYGLAIFGRRFHGWRGTRLAYSSLVGFAVVLFSMFAVNYFLTSFHLFT